VYLGRRPFLRALAGTLASPLASPLLMKHAIASPFDPTPNPRQPRRNHVLFVVIDRPDDAGLSDHGPNVRGLAAAVAAYDRSLRVTALTIDDLATTTAQAIDADLRPLAIIGAGSFTEWYQYGVDADWKRKLDHWMEIIRSTTVPMLAICGSHQLVAAAFNGFGAVAHMNDRGAPVRISQELSAVPPRAMWPSPRIGEEGTYPIVATPEGADDPMVRTLGRAPMAATHHKDMVVDTTGFAILYRGDESRTPATRGADQARVCCGVQAMRRVDRSRLLYTAQFHPEMAAFDESTRGDDGFGAAFVTAFLELARGFWSERSVAIERF
jgi:GMP synthase-like glutamine amidotransferase